METIQNESLTHVANEYKHTMDTTHPFCIRIRGVQITTTEKHQQLNDNINMYEQYVNTKMAN